MDDKKLNYVGLRVWLELLDCALLDFLEGDKQELINEYEHVLESLKVYVHHLKEKK